MEYADRLHVHNSSGNTTTMTVITNAVEQVWRQTGEAPMVVVDYLQKVKLDGGSDVEDERVTVVVEGLKDLALDAKVPVLAIVAADKEGLETGKRLRAQHLRGSTALAYEADVLLVLAHKYQIIARHHLVFDSGAAERSKDWAVVSVEKNRNGRDGVDLEFRKRFDQSRYEQDGHRSPRSSWTSGSTSSSPTRPRARPDHSGRALAHVVGARQALGLVVSQRDVARCGSGRPGRRGPWSSRR